MSEQKRYLPVIALIMANVLWGITIPVIKISLETIPVPIFIAIRFFSAALLMLPFAKSVWQPLKTKQMSLLVVAAIFDITLSVAALNYAITKTTVSNAGVIWLLMPILLLLLSVSFLKEKLSLKTLIGIILALGGSLVIIGHPWNSGGNTSLTGNLLVLLALVLNSVSIIIIKPITKTIHHYQITFLYYLIGVMPMVVYASTRLSSWHISATSTRSLYALLFCILSSAASNTLFYYALKSKTVQKVSVYQYIDPLATIIGAWLLLAERPAALFYLGAIFVAVGVYVVEMRRRSQNMPQEVV